MTCKEPHSLSQQCCQLCLWLFCWLQVLWGAHYCPLAGCSPGGLPGNWLGKYKPIARLVFLDLSHNMLGTTDGRTPATRDEWCQTDTAMGLKAGSGWCPVGTPLVGTVDALTSLGLSDNGFVGECQHCHRRHSCCSCSCPFARCQPSTAPNQRTCFQHSQALSPSSQIQPARMPGRAAWRRGKHSLPFGCRP